MLRFHTVLLAPVIMAALVASPRVYAQERATSRSVEVVAARALPEELQRLGGGLPDPSRVKLDPRVLRRHRTSGESEWAATRSAVKNGAIAGALGAGLAEFEKVYVCESREPTSCRLQGADFVVGLSEPEVSGDGVMIYAKVFFETGQPWPLAVSVLEIKLSEKAGEWQVVEKKEVARGN